MFDSVFGSIFGTVGIILLGLVLVIIAVLTTWRKVPSDKAAVIVGTGKPKVLTGGGTVVIPILQRMDMITLENIMFNVEIKQTKTSLGVPINAEGVVVLKVKNDEASILNAVQQFNSGKEAETVSAIRTQASEVCKGKLREIVSSMSVEDIYNDREAFSAKVQKVAGTELGEMGLELKSFTINDITDSEGYIEALGKEQIAKVKSQAAIAEAEAAKEREIRTAEAKKEQQIKTADAIKIGRQAELEAEAQIAEAEKNKELKILAYKKEQETQKAVSDAAYQIQANITSKDVKSTQMDAIVLEKQRTKEIAEAEVQVQIVAEQKNIELAKKRAERKEAELLETVVKPAEAEKKRREMEAEANKFEQLKKAEAEAEKLALEGQAKAKVIDAQGKAEATAIREKGLAEAEALEKKAEALAKMDEAGKLQMVIEKLPEIAKAVSEPLSKIGNITIIGGSGDGNGGAGEVARYTVGALKAVTEAVKETIGFDITEVMKSTTIQAKTDRNVKLDVTGIPEGQGDQKVASILAKEVVEAIKEDEKK
ncbi:flotillin family protein [Serpentinicella alkaliphila]|uniref:Flotillin n=1 Tax=Serpentinicella alkaliphila TaxID=1734049 RepID=A0A4R2TPY4_9FIRM|nr:flotillin family protein [Serpentinicella alkaliphila]QUH26310.1 flotillin family protein [Serpentinicella alkaliphila]TCQ05890.1 flotillin [Serpentinicella alkaliphila]